MTKYDMKKLGEMLIKTADEFESEQLEYCYIPTIEEGVDISYQKK